LRLAHAFEVTRNANQAVFAIPGILTIDEFGRRPLLLVTFPLMSILLLFTGFCFWIEDTKVRTGLITLGIYLYCMVYSPGEGPVPFTYSAEVYPLYIRELGMGLSTAVLWFFNFIGEPRLCLWSLPRDADRQSVSHSRLCFGRSRCVPIFVPTKRNAHCKPQGAFGWYAGWNAVLFVLVLFFLPETKQYTLEELDQVFSVPTAVHAKYQAYNFVWTFKHYVLRSKEPKRELYHFDESDMSEDQREAEKLARGMGGAGG